MKEERLRILVEALVKLSEQWTKASVGESKGAIYSQIDFIRKAITRELKKNE